MAAEPESLGDDLATPYAAARRIDVLLDLRRPDEALRVVGQALARHPTSCDLWIRASLAHTGAGDKAAALHAAEQAVAFGPEREWAHRTLAIALRATGRHEAALEAGFEAVRLAPTSPWAHLVTGEAALAARNLPTARQAADAALTAGPEESSVHDLMGRVLLAQRNPVEAEKAFRHALTLNPESATSLNNLGVALQGQNRETEAAEAFMRAAALRPEERLYRDNVGLAADRLRSVPWLLIALGYLAVRIGGPFGIPVIVGLVVWYRWRVRHKVVGSNGRPLPEGLWAESVRRKRELRRALLQGWGLIGGGVLAVSFVLFGVGVFVDFALDDWFIIGGLSGLVVGMVPLYLHRRRVAADMLRR